MDQNLPFTPTLNPIPTAISTFSPVTKLFKTAWDRVQRHLLKLFLLTVILFASGVVLLLLSGLIMLAAGFFSPVASGTAYSSVTAIFAIALLLVVVIAMVVGMMALNIATIVLLSETQPMLSLLGLYKMSLRKIVPLLAVSLISAFIVLGGLIVFVIPGILFSILLSLSAYFVILDNVSPIEAMRKSVFVVSKNFGVVFIRMAALIGFSLVAGIVLNMFSAQGGGLALIASLASLIFNLLYGWFSVSYLMLLFQEAKKAAGDGRGKLLWLMIVAVIGWIIIFGGGYLIYRIAANNPAINKSPVKLDNSLLDLEELQDRVATPPASIRPASTTSASIKAAASPKATSKASAATSSANR